MYIGVIRGLHHYGMPVHKHPEIKGNLYVEFELDFPETLSCETAEVSHTLVSRDQCVCTSTYRVCLTDCLIVFVCVIVTVEAGNPPA